MANPFDLDDSLNIDADLRATADAPRAAMHVKLSIEDVLSCADDTNSLYVYGAAGDSVDAGGGWTSVGRETLSGAVFDVYARDGVFLKVECDIDQSLIAAS